MGGVGFGAFGRGEANKKKIKGSSENKLKRPEK